MSATGGSGFSIVATLKTNVEKFNKTMDDVTKRHAESINGIIRGTRRVAQIGISLTGAFAGGVDQILAGVIETGLLSLELISAAAAGTLGVTSIFQYAAIVSLINAIFAAKAGKQELARMFQGINATFRMIQ